MYQSRTPIARTSLAKVLLAVALVIAISATAAKAQQKLGDLVTEGGFDWMIGRWEHETDAGDKLQVIYKWELNKHMISMRFKMGGYESYGMIFYKPLENEVVQVGADNMGGFSKGTWDTDGERAISKSEYTGAGGEIRRFAVAHSKVDADTMKAEVYELDSDGNLAEQPGFTVQYKRQKPQTLKEDSKKTP